MGWREEGRNVLAKIHSGVDLEQIGSDTMRLVYNAYPNDSKKRGSAVSQMSAEIRKKYPHRHEETSGYVYDPSGKESTGNWKHRIFQFLNTKPDNPICQKLENNIETESDTTATTDDVATASTTNTESTLTLKKMIDQLKPELKEMAQATIDAQGIDWQELIEKSLNQYCKGYVNRTQAQADEIGNIETEKLLNDPALRTHPERAKELTKRAIIAIKRHNDNQPENKMRWMISASIIGQLIKSKTTTVNQCLENFKGDTEDHNAKYEFGMMHNRGKGDISNFVDLIVLCPTGE